MSRCVSRIIANWEKQSGPKPSSNSCVSLVQHFNPQMNSVLLNFGTHLAGKQGSEFGHFLNHFLVNSGENICCGAATIRRSVRNSSAFLNYHFWVSCVCPLGTTDVSTHLFVGCNTERRSCSERFNQCSYYWLTATDKKKNKPRRVFTP